MQKETDSVIGVFDSFKGKGRSPDPRLHHRHRRTPHHRLWHHFHTLLLLLLCRQPRRPPPQITRMLLGLRVRQIAAFIGVHGHTQDALELAEVVADDKGVFGEVDGVHGEGEEAAAAVGVLVGGGEEAVGGAGFAAFSVLSVHTRFMCRFAGVGGI